MLGKINQKAIEKAMKKMGIKTEEIDVDEVIFKCKDKDIIVSNPVVSRVVMGGNETFQVSGDVSEVPKEEFSMEDVKIVMEQTGCSEEEARNALKETKDIAAAILKIKNSNV
ncbi:MAG: nascent polypeptide-associated complex protein [Candidatus Aenigmarchaeota archaeon]|nr:nascent polypeptide-associated complex protein [Candidatus Aenigmarchaeota archaeon]